MMKGHEIHKRRWARNAVVGGLLFAFVVLVFFVSIAKFIQQAA